MEKIEDSGKNWFDGTFDTVHRWEQAFERETGITIKNLRHLESPQGKEVVIAEGSDNNFYLLDCVGSNVLFLISKDNGVDAVVFAKNYLGIED